MSCVVAVMRVLVSLGALSLAASILEENTQSCDSELTARAPVDMGKPKSSLIQRDLPKRDSLAEVILHEPVKTQQPGSPKKVYDLSALEDKRSDMKAKGESKSSYVTNLAGTEKTAPANVAWALREIETGRDIIKQDPNPDANLPGQCGYSTDCPRDYSISDLDKTAEASKVAVQRDANMNALTAQHEKQRKACSAVAENQDVLEHGAWCYDLAEAELVTASQRRTDMDYYLPKHHVVADDIFALALAQQVLLKADGSCCYSLTDLGAGVGQYGHALHALLPELEYHGYDGAGNIEEVTNNYVKYADLTMPLSLKQTDWVMSTEVGEHIPHEYEKQVIANIHAHNCKGVILTWAVLGQAGHAHINNHSNDYLIKIFEELGYRKNEKLTATLRLPRPPGQNYSWFLHSSMAFDRITPAC